MHTFSAKDNSMTALFKIALIVRELAGQLRRRSRFQFRQHEALISNGLTISNGDTIWNFVTPEWQKSTEGKVWRGPKERGSHFMTSLILSATNTNGVVVDMTASVGKYFT